MAKRKRTTARRTIKKQIRQGHNQGKDSNYKSWLHAQDVMSSQGKSIPKSRWKTGRMHILPSKLERRYFYILEWSSTVVDIQE